MSKETTIGQLQEVEVLNDNDELVVAQEGQRMARKTNIATLAAKVGESIGGGASMDGEEAAALLTELQTKYAQGKIALAKVLTSKGEPTESKEEIISMVDKVNNLNVESNVTNIRARVWGSASENKSTSAMLCAIKLHNVYDFILYSDGIIYYVPAGNYNSYSEAISASLFSLDTGIVLDSTTKTYYTMYVSMNNRYLLIRGTTAYKLHLYRINSDNFELVKNITTTTSTTSTSYLRNVAVSEDGKVLAFAPGYKIVLYNTDNDTEYTFNSSSFNYGGTVYIKGNRVYAFEANTSSNNKLENIELWDYEVSADGTITATLAVSTKPPVSANNFNVVPLGDKSYYITIAIGTYVGTLQGPCNILKLYCSEFDNQIGSVSIPAEFITFPVGSTSSLSFGNCAAYVSSVKLKEVDDGVEITFPGLLEGQKFIYNNTTRTVTASGEIFCTHPGQYGLRFRGMLSLNGSFMVFGNDSYAMFPTAGKNATHTTLLPGEKLIAKRVKKLDGTSTYYTPGDGLEYDGANAGYYDPETEIVPELPDEE